MVSSSGRALHFRSGVGLGVGFGFFLPVGCSEVMRGDEVVEEVGLGIGFVGLLQGSVKLQDSLRTTA